MNFIMLDTETTGTEEEDRICQLAFIVANKDNFTSYNSLCKPPLPIKLKAMSVHHITEEMVKDKPVFNECEASIKPNEFNTEDNVLIIQNAPFDLKFLKKEGFEWRGGIIDTLRCIRHLKPELESHSLQYLRYALSFYQQEKSIADKLGINIQAHDALGDVVILYLLMKYLVNEVDRDIKKLIELSQKPILYKTITFGNKYKKRVDKYEDIVKKDRQYLEWALNNLDLDSDVKYSIDYYLNKF